MASTFEASFGDSLLSPEGRRRLNGYAHALSHEASRVGRDGILWVVGVSPESALASPDFEVRKIAGELLGTGRDFKAEDGINSVALKLPAGRHLLTHEESHGKARATLLPIFEGGLTTVLVPRREDALYSEAVMHVTRGRAKVDLAAECMAIYQAMEDRRHGDPSDPSPDALARFAETSPILALLALDYAPLRTIEESKLVERLDKAFPGLHAAVDSRAGQLHCLASVTSERLQEALRRPEAAPARSELAAVSYRWSGRSTWTSWICDDVEKPLKWLESGDWALLNIVVEMEKRLREHATPVRAAEVAASLGLPLSVIIEATKLTRCFHRERDSVVLDAERYVQFCQEFLEARRLEDIKLLANCAESRVGAQAELIMKHGSAIKCALRKRFGPLPLRERQDAVEQFCLKFVFRKAVADRFEKEQTLPADAFLSRLAGSLLSEEVTTVARQPTGERPRLARLPTAWTDQELALACSVAAPTYEAWDELYRRYNARMRLFALRYGVRLRGYIEQDDLDDVIQESFVRAFASLQTLRKPQSLGSFLLGVVRHSLLDLCTRRIRKKEAQWTDKVINLMAEAPDGLGEVERWWLDNVLPVALDKMPEQERRVIQLMLEGVGRPEMSDRLGIKPESVSVLRHRALERLRGLVGDE